MEGVGLALEPLERRRQLLGPAIGEDGREGMFVVSGTR